VPHPKLPGTIHTAAEEIERAGGPRVPIRVEIRNEAEVERCVARRSNIRRHRYPRQQRIGDQPDDTRNTPMKRSI